MFAVDGLVILASAFVFDQTAAMYALICTFLMLILSATLLYHLSQKPEVTNNTTIGQNYMTRDTSEK